MLHCRDYNFDLEIFLEYVIDLNILFITFCTI